MILKKEEREYARPSALPNWMKDFAEDKLKKESKGINPFDEIRELFQFNKGLSAVEQKVSELTERIGLNKLNANKNDIVKNASDKKDLINFVKFLLKEAERLDKEGNFKSAFKLDIIANRIQKKIANCVPVVLKENPSLKMFIDNVCSSRGGHISQYAIIKMIRDERPESIEISNELKDYIKEKLNEEKQEVSDSASDLIAGRGVGIDISRDEQMEANKMWEPSDPL